MGWLGAGVLAAGLALAPASASAYRTFADDPEVAYPAVHADATIEWDIAFSAVDTGDLAAIEEAAAGAVGAWSEPGCADASGAFRGTRSGRAVSGDGRNTIELVGVGWAERFPSSDDEHASRGAFAEVLLRETADGWEIAEADIYVDFDGHRWTVEGAGEGRLDLRAVLTHEWGHLLGFDHPREGDPDAMASVMFPTYRGMDQRALSADDVAGVCALYPSGVVACEPECGEGERCVDGACVEICLEGDCACADRSCDVMCATDAECVEGDRCSVAGADHGWCSASGSFGTPCTEAADCRSELCLTSMRSGTFCTARCTTSADCGEALACETVDGARVCVAPLVASSCTARRGARPGWLPICLSVAALAALAHRRKKKS